MAGDPIAIQIWEENRHVSFRSPSAESVLQTCGSVAVGTSDETKER